MWVDGSYITTKPEPGDYDATFDAEALDWIALGLAEPELLDFDAPRTTQKRVCELFPMFQEALTLSTSFNTTAMGTVKASSESTSRS